MICEPFCVLALIIQRSSHALGSFAQSTTTAKHYFHTVVEVRRGLVGQNVKLMCLRSRQSNTKWTQGVECDNTFYFYMNYCDAAPQTKSD